MSDEIKTVLIFVGPTAVGKTRLSVLVAQLIKEAEIISADSRQVYRFMDIGTAKPSVELRKQVVHHFIDIKFPDENYSAGQFGQEARQKIDEILEQGKKPIVVGGSGLYIKALVDGLFEPRISDPKIKEYWKEQIEYRGLRSIFQYLQKVDPVSAQKIHPNDAHRIVRALEVYQITGVPLSQYQQQKVSQAHFTPFFVGLTRQRESLYQCIEHRVDHMIQLGLVDEVRELKKMGYGPELNALQTVGYKEAFAYLNGQLTHPEMAQLIKKNTRNYAKRQLTWFRADARINWVEITEQKDFGILAGEIIQRYKELEAIHF